MTHSTLRTLIHDHPVHWTGADLSGLTETPAGLTVTGPEGTLLSAPLTASAFDELLPSWNAVLAPGGALTLDVRAQLEGGDWTRWYTFGTWTQGDGRASVDDQDDAHGRMLTDTLRLTAPATTFQYRVRLTGDGSALQLLAFCTTERGAQQGAAPRPGRAEQWGTELDIPARSQMIHEGGSGWCSPTCLSMVMSPLGTERSVPDTAAAVFDHTYEGTGNWAFNVAYAGSQGHRAYLTRLADLQAAEDELARGVAPILSIAWQQGELPGAPIPSSRGHLVVLRGFDAAGNPVINDPAAPTDDEVRRVYPRAEFERQWLGHSGGLAYLIGGQTLAGA